MKCPSCGEALGSVSVAGFDYSYRCQKCGGVWVANWVVNNLASGKELGITAMGDGVRVGAGNNKCPTDGASLVGVPAEVVPEGVAVEKCNQCGWWWFPGDEIFKFLAANKAKREYVKLWNKSEWMSYAWPALVLTLLVGGLTGSVWLVREQQRAAIIASESVRELSAIQTGPGELEVRFRTGRYVRQVEYKEINDLAFRLTDVKPEGEYYVARVSGLRPGVYVVKVLEREVSVSVQ